jgi:hypothetical protein
MGVRGPSLGFNSGWNSAQNFMKKLVRVALLCCFLNQISLIDPATFNFYIRLKKNGHTMGGSGVKN